VPGSDEGAIGLAKTVLRKAVQLRRDCRSEETRRHDDLARLSLVRERLSALRPRTIACYLSAGSEPGTLPLVGWLAAHDVEILLPVVSDGAGRRREPGWARYAGPDALRTGRAGIVEPTGPFLAADAIAQAELVVCPGVAGSERGERLGRGGGWYDRVLAHAGGPVWLLLNDDEVLPELPVAPWDRPVDALVTPTRFLTGFPDAATGAGQRLQPHAERRGPDQATTA
jgi:5-formyltetrahydrofolate cyclo-ligase